MRSLYSPLTRFPYASAHGAKVVLSFFSKTISKHEDPLAQKQSRGRIEKSHTLQGICWRWILNEAFVLESSSRSACYGLLNFHLLYLTRR
ncbi:hypothetical protein KP509_20G048000 [Ceratopteris richardii]|uniref:Uncharacterized protein n=1 Tax=Ceratopteris richardii TaxID=49495 RepID=A0A8T2SIE5_CERRI|nr:hypothetical protein KP509_20G048000 [Ceratopteris richardii]